MTPKTWRNKDERQYKHVKKQLMDNGKTRKTAEEVAARIVNKQRRIEGKTDNVTTKGTGNPNKKLEDRTRQELYNRARQLRVTGRSKMNKSELIKTIRQRQ